MVSWFKLKEIDFPANPLLCGMDNPTIQLICKYNSAMHEKDVINNVVF